MKAPPKPWMARATKSIVVCERPPMLIPLERAQSSEPVVKIARPVTNIRLRPKMSPSRPTVTRKTARAMV